MSRIALEGNALGTGTFTIASPNSNTSRTLTLPDATGTINTSGSVNEVPAGTAGAPSVTFTGDLNTGIYSPGADRIGFAEGGVQVGEFDASGNFLFNSGYGSAAVAYGCRAWVNFNGTGTVAIRASGNVSSITDNGTGDYTVNFTNAMPDANYSTCAMTTGFSNTDPGGYSANIKASSVSSNATLMTTTQFSFITGPSGSRNDPGTVCFAIFR